MDKLPFPIVGELNGVPVYEIDGRRAVACPDFSKALDYKNLEHVANVVSRQLVAHPVKNTGREDEYIEPDDTFVLTVMVKNHNGELPRQIRFLTDSGVAKFCGHSNRLPAKEFRRGLMALAEKVRSGELVPAGQALALAPAQIAEAMAPLVAKELLPQIEELMLGRIRKGIQQDEQFMLDQITGHLSGLYDLLDPTLKTIDRILKRTRLEKRKPVKMLTFPVHIRKALYEMSRNHDTAAAMRILHENGYQLSRSAVEQFLNRCRIIKETLHAVHEEIREVLGDDFLEEI